MPLTTPRFNSPQFYVLDFYKHMLRTPLFLIKKKDPRRVLSGYEVYCPSINAVGTVVGEVEGGDNSGIYVAHKTEGNSYGIHKTNSKAVQVVNSRKEGNPLGKPLAEVEDGERVGVLVFGMRRPDDIGIVVDNGDKGVKVRYDEWEVEGWKDKGSDVVLGTDEELVVVKMTDAGDEEDEEDEEDEGDEEEEEVEEEEVTTKATPNSSSRGRKRRNETPVEEDGGECAACQGSHRAHTCSKGASKPSSKRKNSPKTFVTLATPTDTPTASESVATAGTSATATKRKSKNKGSSKSSRKSPPVAPPTPPEPEPEPPQVPEYATEAFPLLGQVRSFGIKVRRMFNDV
jgi:hypothetical protein